MSSALAAYQDAFVQALLAHDREPADAYVARLAVQPGFAVYRNTVMKGAIDALQANYPAVARLVGDEWFRAAAAIFARAQPPARATLLHYGERFADFLAGFGPAQELPYLPGVARLDRCWTEAHSAADEAPVASGAVAALAPAALARAVLRPHAAARWAWFEDMPVATIWQRNRGPGAAGAVAEADLEWRGEGLLLARPRGVVAWHDIGRAGCAFLDACAAGAPLAAAATAALAAAPGVDLARMMQTLLEAGACGRLIINDTTTETSP
jgi:hypothetical protein